MTELQATLVTRRMATAGPPDTVNVTVRVDCVGRAITAIARIELARAEGPTNRRHDLRKLPAAGYRSTATAVR